MLDNILSSVRRGAEKVQRRGEEVAQVARLRVEIFQLGRELDSAYARLGRAYHSGGDMPVLRGIREEISRVEDEIAARERLIAELDHAQVGPDGTPASPAQTPDAETAERPVPTLTPAPERPGPGSTATVPGSNRPDFTAPGTQPNTGELPGDEPGR